MVLPGSVPVAEVKISASEVSREIEALESAVAKTVSELRKLRESISVGMGGPVGKIFDAQLLMASDQEFIKQAKQKIRQSKRNAGFVYNQLVRTSIAPLRSSHDHYMRQTALDIEAVADRVLSRLTGYDTLDLNIPPNTILVGKNFGPGELLRYRRLKGVGFIVSEGGADSHMALISRALLLPVVLAADAWTSIPNDARVILDGTTGRIIVHPADDEWSEYKKLRKRQGTALITRIRRLPEIPPLTLDNCPVGIAANLSLPGPADDIIASQNIPVGLYRTEFMYLVEGRYPDEESQYESYLNISRQFSKTSVVLRTFDIGYDKVADNDWPYEGNPALGWRGIRAMLDMADVFKTQIRAILRASTAGNLKIMLPMVATLNEIDRARKLISQVKLGLRRERIPFDENIPLGIMVEIPAAALIADALARKVDFMSIGTNDLTQYTMAADRMNQRVAHLYDPFNPAVLNLIHLTVTAGRKHGVPVSICGEIAGDLLALPLFIGMGVTTLSMGPHLIYDLCQMVSKIDSRLVRHLVGAVITSSSSKSVRRKLENFRSEIEK